ncbi:MAG: STAS domain-containing protein [Sedimentisphaerales bacterium]|nr:STAS domain-containing protein [Sedimentisphaerales bacterium]
MSEPSFIKSSERDGVMIVEFTEPTILSSHHIEKAEKELFALIEEKSPKRLVLDFSTIKMLSSKTISVLLKMREELQSAGGAQMAISGIEPGLYRVFKVTKLESIFNFYDDTDSAIAALKDS